MTTFKESNQISKVEIKKKRKKLGEVFLEYIYRK